MAALTSALRPLEVATGPVLAEPLPPGRPVRWGIVATGKIAHLFATALALLPDAEIAAVGSRRRESAAAFAAEFGARSAYDSYEAVASDPAVDIVYVATPHALHVENVVMALEAGKPVLCEKPLALNSGQTEALLGQARAKRLFLMEAMWMRCIPLIRRLQQLLATGDLGVVRQVRADLGFVVEASPRDRLLNPALGAGALLDMGIYPLTFSRLFLGEPEVVTAAAGLSDRGVDLDLTIGLVHPGGATASLTSTMTAVSPRSASIATDLGRFDVLAPFHHGTTATWTSDGSTQTLHEGLIGTGLAHEAIEVMRCLRSGEIESPMVPHTETLAVMRLMDRIRTEIGVAYDADARVLS